MFGFSIPATLIAIAGIVVALLTSHGVVYYNGKRDERSVCDAAKWKTAYESLQKSAAETKRRLDSAEVVQKNDAQRAAQAEERLKKLQEAVNATPENTGACLDRDAVRRVRGTK